MSVEYLRGVEVIAEARFIVKGKHSQTFEWKGHGLKLSIPEGALLSDSVIVIKASLAGQFDLPTNTQLVSPIYWIHSSEKFQQPVVLEMQHCTAVQNELECSLLHFVAAKCSQKELPYKFKVLHNGTFSKYSSYGTIEAKQFSLLGIVFEKSKLVFMPTQPRTYFAKFFRFNLGINVWRVDFVITWNHELCITVSLAAIMYQY